MSGNTIEDTYMGGTRANVTFLTGPRCNGKTEWLHKMLDQRKKECLDARFNKIKARFLREQKEKITQSLGITEFTEDDVEGLLDFIDTDPEWRSLTEFVEKHPNNEIGYGCHIISLKEIEETVYPKGYRTERQRDKIIQTLVKEIWASLYPDPEPYEVATFDDEGRFTGQYETKYITKLPKNLFVDGSLNAKEIKQIIRELKDKARSKFVMCYYTCFVYDEAGVTGSVDKPTFDNYTVPDKECGYNAHYFFDKNGMKDHKTFDELAIL